MAVGYHKLNTSAARSKRAGSAEIDASKINFDRMADMPSGTEVWSPQYGFGLTTSAISHGDTGAVNIKFEIGIVMFRADFVINRMVEDAAIQRARAGRD